MSKKLKTKKQDRQVFYLNDDETKPITAGGVLIYKYVNDKLKFLIIDSRNMYEDIGGKCDKQDESIYDAISREVEEETNGQIKAKHIINRLKRTTSIVYAPKSKYVIYIVEATEREKGLKKSDFGDTELHDDFLRNITWINKDKLFSPEIIKNILNPRMKNRNLFIEIEKLVKKEDEQEKPKKMPTKRLF